MKGSIFLILFLGLFLYVGCTPKVIKTEEIKGSVDIGKEIEEKKVEVEREGKEAQEEKVGKIKEEEIKIEQIEKKGKTFEELLRSSPLKDVHFDFDSYSIRKEDLELLREIGRWLKENRKERILIEGHCDERGTVEYNLILGQKRADAVKAYLMGLGINEERLRTISYGKERPIDPAHTEEAWAKNRRAHFEIER